MKIETHFNVIAFADTRPGGRSENQDTCAYADTPFGILVTVCDGMGGGPAGKCASLTAANSIVDFIRSQKQGVDRCKLLEDAILYANDMISQAVSENPSLAGMGTTATVLLINAHSAVVAHVGDSRVYQLRSGRKKFRTFDHSMVFQWVKDGEMTEEEARVSDQSNIITQALGVQAGSSASETKVIKVDVKELSYEPGDRFILCSDGIWGMFPEKEIIKMASTPRTVSGAVENLVVRVDDHGFATGGHHDNLTVAIVETKSYSKFKEKMSTRLKRIFIGLMCLCLASVSLNIFQYCSNRVPASSDSEDVTSVKEDVNIDSLIDKKLKDMREAEAAEKESKQKEAGVREKYRQIKENNGGEVTGRDSGQTDESSATTTTDKSQGKTDKSETQQKQTTPQATSPTSQPAVSTSGGASGKKTTDKQTKQSETKTTSKKNP